MRIIAGYARGIRLAVPDGGEPLRPTEDRVKESLFSTLGDLEGAVVLDLFAGTGALGLEALSRGAKEVVLVERDPKVDTALVCKIEYEINATHDNRNIVHPFYIDKEPEII